MHLANIEGKEIVIRIPIDALPDCAEIAWENHYGEHSLYVDDLEEFAKSFIYALNDESETGETVLHRAFDSAIINLTENGELGLNDKDNPF